MTCELAPSTSSAPWDHSGEHAALIADMLVDADLRGYDDHGVAMLAPFSTIQKIGRFNPAPAIRVVRATESSLLLDGDGGLGVAPGMQAMRWCVARAKERHGIACIPGATPGTSSRPRPTSSRPRARASSPSPAPIPSP